MKPLNPTEHHILNIYILINSMMLGV